MESHDIAGVAERLAGLVAGVPAVQVAEAVSTCAAEIDTASPLLLEQAALARLTTRPDPGAVTP